MNVFQEAFAEATMDCIYRLVAENDTLTRIIQADDCLEIAAQVRTSDTKKRLCLAPDFIRKMDTDLDAKCTPISYFNASQNKYLSLNNYARLENKSGFAPVYKRFCNSDADTIIEYVDNILSVRIHKLQSFVPSRYKTLIRSLIDSQLFTPKHRTHLTDKRTYNATRQIILRRFFIKRYEWCFMFNAAISAVLYRALCRIAAVNGITQHGNTFYLHDSPRSQCKIKIYNFDAAQPTRRNKPPEFRPGDRLKFEITYKHEFFRKHTNLTINIFTCQNNIAETLYTNNKRQLQTHLLSKLTPQESKNLFNAAGVNDTSEFMAIFADNETTQVSTDKRLAEIESKIKQLAETMDYQAGEIEKIKADTAAEFEKIKAFIGYTETKQDTRKLRLVKAEK
jgi:hypothetical protein